jgi:undecaprenyl-diphosphatase
MDWLAVLLMAVVQGIAEFLPISSSGHLILLGTLLKDLGFPLPEDLLGLSIVLHAGTLASIVVFYWHRLWRLLDADRKLVPLIVLATLPAVFSGLVLKEQFTSILESPVVTGAMLLVTGSGLIWLSRQVPGELDLPDLTWQKALRVGLCQGVAVLPGISRSGSTIAGGLLTGLRRDSAATFSFLLAIPVTAGACVLEARDLWQEGGERIGMHPAPLILGAIVSCLVGLVALRWLLSWLQKGRLHYFGYWCLAVGITTLIWQGLTRAG